MDVAVVSVIATGLVGLSALAVPLITDLLKSKREAKTAEVHRIQQALTDVLDALAPFWRRHASGEDYGALARSYYVWELLISPYCSDQELKGIAWIRTSLEGVTAETVTAPLALRENIAKLANTMADTTRTVIGKVRV